MRSGLVEGGKPNQHNNLKESWKAILKAQDKKKKHISMKSLRKNLLSRARLMC